jgi:hypothetical protein
MKPFRQRVRHRHRLLQPTLTCVRRRRQQTSHQCCALGEHDLAGPPKCPERTAAVSRRHTGSAAISREQAYHIVTPVPHCLFEIVGAAIGFAEALKSFDAKQPLLFLFSDATHGPTQGGGHGQIRFQIAQEFLVILVKNGNLNVDQKSQLLAKGRQRSVSVYGIDQQLLSEVE